MRFFVTSLASAKPVEGAAIRLEGLRDDKFVTLVEGRTDGEGAFTWDVGKRAEAQIKRIVVEKGLDALVLDPANGPAAICAGELDQAGRCVARLDGQPGRRAQRSRRKRSATSSPSGRSTGPRSRCRSRAMCAAIRAAR